MPAPVAASLLGGIRGLAAGIPADADPQARDAALAAHRRLVAHVERAALNGPPDAALGPAALAALLGTAEAMRRSTSARSPPGPTPSGTGCAPGSRSRPR